MQMQHAMPSAMHGWFHVRFLGIARGGEAGAAELGGGEAHG